MRYRLQVTEISDAGTRDVFDEIGHAYVVGTATLTGNRIDAPVNHDGPQFLQERLVAYIAEAVSPG